MDNGGELSTMEHLLTRLRVLSRINVERKVRLREDVDLMCQYRFEMLLLKVQMDTMLKMLADKGVITKDEYAKRSHDYVTEVVEQLQTALHLRVMNDGRIIRA